VETWHEIGHTVAQIGGDVIILRPPVEPENGTVWTKNQANLTPTKMTLNASRQLDLNFDGRNWKDGQDI
jgi:hypothetical protein